MLSVIVPALNEERNIEPAARRIRDILLDAGISYELIFVDDGSRDATWERICRCRREDPRIAGVRLSRNFGKEAAILAGLEKACGECSVVLDCDLQHPPETIVEMVRLWEDGVMVVEGVKRSRGKENPVHGFFSRLFYRIMSAATHVDMARASDFRLLDRKVVQELLAMPERNTFFRALSSWMGYRTATVEYDVAERLHGKSKWSVSKLVRYAIQNMISFSSAPLRFIACLSAVSLLLTFILGVQTLVRFLMGHSVDGFTTVILLILMLGTLLLVSQGIMSLYLAKMFEEIKARPRYLVAAYLAPASFPESEEEGHSCRPREDESPAELGRTEERKEENA